MTQEHPITPPPELVREWMKRTEYDEHTWFYESYIAEQAAQWGADQELEACVDWLSNARNHTLTWNEATNYSANLRAARRPKPPSLKKQALEALRHAPGPDYPNPITLLTADEHALIRRALEQLDD